MNGFTITNAEMATILKSLETQQKAVETRLKRLEEINQEIYNHRSNHGR